MQTTEKKKRVFDTNRTNHMKEKASKIMEAHKQGKSVKEISVLLKCKDSTIRRILIRNGKEPRDIKRCDREAIVADYCSGMNPKEIAQKHKCVISTVYYIIRYSGKKQEPDTHYDEIVADYESGMDSAIIAKKYSCSRACIYHVLATRNIPRRKKGNTGVNRDAVIEMYEKTDKTLEEIGAEFGVTRQRIEQIIRKRGKKIFDRRSHFADRFIPHIQKFFSAKQKLPVCSKVIRPCYIPKRTDVLSMIEKYQTMVECLSLIINEIDSAEKERQEWKQA